MRRLIWLVATIAAVALMTGTALRWALPGMAEAASLRADCSRRQVGCVLVKDNRIVSTGYNGTTHGAKGCLEGGCPRATSNAKPGENSARLSRC
jgi:deoxycytidylate deaminase